MISISKRGRRAKPLQLARELDATVLLTRQISAASGLPSSRLEKIFSIGSFDGRRWNRYLKREAHLNFEKRNRIALIAKKVGWIDSNRIDYTREEMYSYGLTRLCKISPANDPYRIRFSSDELETLALLKREASRLKKRKSAVKKLPVCVAQINAALENLVDCLRHDAGGGWLAEHPSYAEEVSPPLKPYYLSQLMFFGDLEKFTERVNSLRLTYSTDDLP